MISVIGTVGVPACYGGFESLIENLLPSEKVALVYCSSRTYSNKIEEYKGAKLKYLPFNANGIQSIPYDIYSILHSLLVTKNDLLVLGVSGALALPIFKLFSNRKIVTNIDGLEWKRDKWGSFARSFLRFSEKIAVKFSDVVIADNAAIAKHVKSTYGVDSEVIAYGGNHAIRNVVDKEKGNYSLALCRIEPENNVEMILESFSQLESENIKFIGNWNNSQFGKDLKTKYSSFANIQLLDPIYDLDELFKLREKAKWYFHGHSAGGTNPSLVEMMFFDIPIFCFDCSYNRASTEENAIYFNSSEALSKKISSAKNVNYISMKEIANRRYTWAIVKRQYEALF